jgi:hypothetical protein
MCGEAILDLVFSWVVYLAKVHLIFLFFIRSKTDLNGKFILSITIDTCFNEPTSIRNWPKRIKTMP